MVPFISYLCGENRIPSPNSFESFSLALRREQDSNLRTGFAGYTLSRRASSTTRAPLLFQGGCKGTNKRGQYKTKNDFFVFIVERKYFRRSQSSNKRVKNQIILDIFVAYTANTALRQANTAPYTADTRAR